MEQFKILAAFSFLAILVKALLSLRSRKPPGVKSLPGPKGKLFVGSKLGKGYFWFKFSEWAEQYGPIYQYKSYGRVNVVISTEKIANDLLRERGTIYSSREQLPMASQLLSDNKKAIFIPYNDTWRTVRKFQHQVTMPKAATSYQPLQLRESARLVRDLILEPTKYHTLFQRYASGLILRLTYDERIETGEEETVRLVYANQVNVERVATPGRYLVDVLPILLWVPKWLAPFKQEADAHRKREVKLFSGLVEKVKKNVEAGTAGPSFTRKWLEGKEEYGMSDLQAAYVLGGLFSAAASTTASLAMSWVLMMVLHPKWLVKAQEELDRVVGSERLPTFDDMPNLPMIRAIVKETARIRPVTAGGVAHKTTADDVYEGYFIPKGSLIHANQWAIHHDPELYPDPESFNPDRWLNPKYPTFREPLSQYPNCQNYSVFGFGRRLCPGANIAERSINIIVARVSWACNITKSKDPKTGKLITPPAYDYVNSLNTEPRAFPFDLSCRSPERWEIIDKEADEALKELRKTHTAT
ncbi:cytochrome P450 [Plenodomus tracheiphilus IPT5]|uniref:Cytochrome P450 n=1 Tax=Plenodomus tracheiphilus IPT5 TaxID=1408161 RepID=A0A6A7BBE3_9PLEO|nr:cytochrome P450 [Plenodomus tracheiphilus IPT5]